MLRKLGSSCVRKELIMDCSSAYGLFANGVEPSSAVSVPTTKVFWKSDMSAFCVSTSVSMSPDAGRLSSKNVSRPGPPVTRSLPIPPFRTSLNGEPMSVSPPALPFSFSTRRSG